jgi:hypothetical protein
MPEIADRRSAATDHLEEPAMTKPRHLGIAAIAAGSLMLTIPAVAISGVASSAPSSQAATSSSFSGLTAVGLAGGGTRLTGLSVGENKTIATVTVRGLSGGDTALIGIDYRVQDGKLYGVGNNAGSAGVYAINTSTGVATQLTRLSVALNGTSFGVDFNPAANALRIVSNTGQNLRQPLATLPSATVNDTQLTYPPALPVASGITAAAYTNNDLDATTGTTLFDLDTSLDQVAIQSPANSGTLAVTGKLGVDGSNDVGFDIYSVVVNGATVDLLGLATLNGSLMEIDLLTGKAKFIRSISTSITDIAIPLDQG